MSSKVTCSSCGWSWNKSDSSKKDLYVCHQCGKDNTMKDGGWLNKYNDVPEAQNGIEGTMGGLTDVGFDYNGAWGGTMQMGGSLPGSVGFTYARTQSPAPSNGKYAKKTKASAQTGEAIVKTDAGGGAPDDGYIKLDPTKFSLTTTRGVSETFDPSNAKWTGQSTEWLQKRISNAELLVQAIKDARSLSKKEWEEKYKGASFAAVGEGKAQPILPDFYNDYKKRDDAFIQDWSQARDQAKNELLMQSRWTANKEKAKKEALDFLGQYKNQNEFLSSIPTQASEKYGYTPGELDNFKAWDFLSKDAVSKAYYAINANKGFPLPQDPTNEMTCMNGVCTLESMIGVDFSPLKGQKGVYYDKKTGKTIPQYNPTWLENNNYEKVGYRKLQPGERPYPGDIAQHTNQGVPSHMELVLEHLPDKGLFVYNNYSQTKDNKPGEGKEARPFLEGTYQPYQFEKTEYFRLTPEAQQKALSRNPTYLKKVEGKKAFESSEDYKKFMETQEYIKANQEKYNKFNQLNPQDWRNGGRTSAQNGMEMKFYQEGLDWKPKNISRDGGLLNKFQNGTPDSGVPKTPYWKNKIYRGPSQFDECEGEGCSKQATEDVSSLYGADYASLNPQDAWYKRAAVIKSGGQEIYNKSQGDLKSIYGDLRVGDFVSLDRPGSPHAEDPSKVEGYTLADNEGTEHVGYVIGFDANGVPLIKHGHEGNILSDASSYVQPITDLSLPDLGLNYKVNSIYRAKPLLNNDKELNSNYYKDLLPQKDLSFYDKDRLTYDKQEFINAYNRNSEKFQRETGLSPEEIAAIGNVAYGILGNESKFNESLYRPIKQLGAEALHALGLRDTPPSLGPTQLKYEQVAENKDKSKTRKGKLMRALGVKKSEIDNIFHPTDYDAVTSATFASLAENYKKLTTDPEFGYDPEKNTVLGNVPLGMALAKSWQNPSLKNVKESLQKGDSDYANAAYRNMSELEGQMFPGKLSEVVIRPEKKNGGWLSKYDDGGIIEDPMGQWAHPGEITRIPSNQITMEGVDYPVLGISDTGDTKMMQPGEEYKFKGKSVTEIPMAQDGITRGGYDDPDYVTGTSRRAFNKMVGMGNYLVPANTLNRAADLAKTKGLDYGATTSGPADAVRHAAAAASVASRLPIPKFIGQYSPDLERAIRIAGANILGVGHEIMSPNSEGLLMDIKNNYQGSLIGSIPGLNDNTRNQMIVNQLQKNKLTVDNPKKPKKENGGWLNKYK